MIQDSVIVGLWKVKSTSDNRPKKFYPDVNFTICIRSMILIILSNVEFRSRSKLHSTSCLTSLNVTAQFFLLKLNCFAMKWLSNRVDYE